jgi:integrase
VVLDLRQIAESLADNSCLTSRRVSNLPLQACKRRGRGIRDLAMIWILLGCGLRRAELASLRKEDIQVRQGHWAIVDLIGKEGHVRTVPVPAWVKELVDRWMLAAKVTEGHVFRLSAGMEQPGALEYQKTWFGTLSGSVLCASVWNTLLRTTCAVLAPNCAT